MNVQHNFTLYKIQDIYEKFEDTNRIGGVIVSVFVLSAVDRGVDNNIGICCFSSKYAALRRKNKDWLVRNQDNVSDMSIRGL